MEMKSMAAVVVEAGRKEETKKKRLATLVGCNYAGTRYELRGCINDVRAMRTALVARFGFAPADIAVLTDDLVEGDGVLLPTGANIKKALAGMVARAAPGDVLFFHYSGHGTLVPPRDGDGDGNDDEEAIVPCDFNLLTDVDFRELVDKVPPGATFTMVSDSCHSGGLIDQEKEQIGPSSADSSDLQLIPAAPARTARTSRRFLPYAALVDHLSGVSGMASHHHVADHLVALFGADASAKFHVHADDGSTAAAPARRPDEGILLSGCQTDETSADVPAEDDGEVACGAFSSAVQSVLASHPAPLSNREVVARARAVLDEQGYEQHPCLYCTDANAEAPFLSQNETKTAAPPAAMHVVIGGGVIRVQPC